MRNTFKGIDTSKYDSVIAMHLNKVDCIKGNLPEIVKTFFPMPVPFVLALKHENHATHYTLFQMETDEYTCLCSGEKIATKDDGSIYVWEEKINEFGQKDVKIYLLSLDDEAFYVKTELIFH